VVGGSVQKSPGALDHCPFHQRETVSQTPGFPFRAGESADDDADVATVAVTGGGGDEADGGAEVSAAVIGGVGGDEGGGGTEVAAVVVTGGDEAGGGAEVAAVVFAGFAFVRAAGDFTTAGVKGASSAMTGSGVMSVVGALPDSPDCTEFDSFTAMRTGTLCG
jgi:hypothetical protein